MVEANDPTLKSWVEVPKNSDFPIQNLPFGVFESPNHTPRIGVAIGEKIVDLYALNQSGLLSDLDLPDDVLENEFLNDLISLGKAKTNRLRNRLADLLRHDNDELKDSTHRAKVMVGQSAATMRMPVKVGDYTDFYSSMDHATNVGKMFRDPENALLPNWKHLPVGYHGRASSIVVSGTPIHRPVGQTKPNEDEPPVFGPCKLLDFELEMAFITGKATELGSRVNIDNAEEYIFGLALFNDLSARDIQKWEYVPLGPFLAKNFGSAMSPWIVTLEALEPFRVEGYEQDPEVLDYLKYHGKKNYNIDLEVSIKIPSGEEKTVCHSNFKYMYWNMCQQLAHQTVTGCNINVGDLYASGTISGPDESQFGSMLEISWRGTKPVAMPDGSERKFIQDGDTIIMRGHGVKNGVRLGFGECVTPILPAKV